MDCARAVVCLHEMKPPHLKVIRNDDVINAVLPAGVEQRVVEVQHKQQLARRQQPPQVGRPQPRRLRTADPEVRLDVPAPGVQPGCVRGAI